MAVVYVISKTGKPLMPTTRCGHVRILLKKKKARVVSIKPFTIQLLKETTEAIQPLVLGIDPGRTNIGLAVVKENAECVFNAEVVTRNKDIPKLMAKRKAFRMAHRKLRRRDKRRRRAVNAGTIRAKAFERILPGCDKPVICHDIKNKEARFLHRTRPEGWFTPTANHLLQTHINAVVKICKSLPVSSIVLEVNKFAFMAMDNPKVQKWQYRKGQLYNKGSVNDAVYAQQEGLCLLCMKAGIDRYHHLVPKHQGGSNTLSNIAGLCTACHDKVHTDDRAKEKLATKKAGLNKKYGALSVLNQIISALTDRLGNMLPMYVTEGRSTAEFRKAHNIDKQHSFDAYCIACSILKNNINTKEPDKPLFYRQYRRHDRAACHQEMMSRKYYVDGKVVCANRHKAYEQTTDSLEEYRQSHTQAVISRLAVKPHPARYKNPDRVFPGSLIACNNQMGILQASSGFHNGKPDCYVMTNGKKENYSKCTKVRNNEGLVII